MSNKFSIYKRYAELAWASYNKSEIESSDPDVLKKNIDLPKNIKKINNKVIHGFQASLYQDTKTGEKILAIRGTDAEASFNGLDDINNDVLLTLFGGNAQLNDLERYYEELIDNGFLSPNEKITVVGHSLGGFLTQYFSVVHNDIVDNAYTFNAPGLGGIAENLSGMIVGKDLKNIGNITNIIAKDGLSATSILGSHAGKEIKVSGNSHAIEDLTQILYFYDMAVSNGASENVVTNYLSGFYNTPNSLFSGSVAKTAQSTISQIEQIVGKANGANDIIEICNAYENNNVKFNLDLISPNSSVTSFFSGSNLSTPALYALVNLNPFIVSGIKPRAYTILERYKDDFTKGYIEDKAKMFKAALTSSRTLDNKYYQDNISGIKIKPMFDNTGIVSSGDIKEQYYFGSNERDIITINSNGVSSNAENKIYTLAGDDTIIASKGNNYIEAGSGNDTIDLSRTSKNSKNIVYADIKGSKHSDNKNNNNDTIIGGAGTDTIYGGSGFDTYRVGNGDTIYDDKDGEGTVFFNNIELTGGTYDKDKACYVGGIYEYHLNGNTLIVTDTAKNESITINNYSKKDKS
ncbi:MAG: hypothetical protein PUK41_08355, partial [Campylobacter hominis]|nr:hypothetical protein [Campylobacter hominis]